jgi:glycerophosphoryl diester phosphodiesterase
MHGVVISHRGNINGPDPLNENKIESIVLCIEKYSLNVEIDIHVKQDDIYLTHDDIVCNSLTDEEKKILIRYKDYLWIHCKNIEAISFMSKFYPEFNYFGHSNDDFVLTSKGYIFTKPSKAMGSNIICVMPEMVENITNDIIYSCKGILTDYPLKYEKNYTIIGSQ